MQTVLPVFVAAPPVVERADTPQAIKAPAEAGSSQLDSQSNPEGKENVLPSDRAREAARQIFGDPEQDYPFPGFPPLDTREVGDRDIIDPDRPAVRGPEPLESLETQDALPPLPDEVTVGGAEVDEADEVAALPGTPETDAGTQDKGAENSSATTAAIAANSGSAPPGPTVTAQPASPGASAPDVPEPPAPGTVDIRR